MAQFELQHAQFLEETPAARLWKVLRKNGDVAVLKVYVRGQMGNEATGMHYMRRAQPFCAQVYDFSEDALLLEWLEGPALADQARSGGEAECRATDLVLAEMAASLTRAAVSPNGLHTVEALFAPLTQAQDMPNGPMRDAQVQARALLVDFEAMSSGHIGLHGDLHPGNIRLHQGHWRAFDAKGVRGPRVYELANAFRHPRGCVDYSCAPQTIDRRVQLWSQALGCPPQELLAWAVAKVALSLVWNQLETGPDRELLQALLRRL